MRRKKKGMAKVTKGGGVKFSIIIEELKTFLQSSVKEKSKENLNLKIKLFSKVLILILPFHFMHIMLDEIISNKSTKSLLLVEKRDIGFKEWKQSDLLRGILKKFYQKRIIDFI